MADETKAAAPAPASGPKAAPKAAPKASPAPEPKAKSGTKCPVTRAEFTESAKPLLVKIGDAQVILNPKEFKTGSFGYFSNEKVIVQVGGTPVKFQANLQLAAIGSKDEAGDEE